MVDQAAATAPAAAPTPAAAPAAAPAPAAAAPASAPAAAPAASPAAAPAPAPADDGIKFGGDEPADATKIDETKAEDKPADATPVDPASYDLKLPDGMTLADEALSGVKAKFAAANLSPDQAQAMFDAHIEGLKTATETAQKSVLDAWAAKKAEWEGEIKADPEIGGAKLPESLSQIRKGADALLGTAASKAFRDALDSTGAGSNPAIVKAMFKAFSQHAPARTETGQPGSGETKSMASRVYPNQGKPTLGNSTL